MYKFSNFQSRYTKRACLTLFVAQQVTANYCTSQFELQALLHQVYAVFIRFILLEATQLQIAKIFVSLTLLCNIRCFHLQPILKGLSGDADHVADADRLERSGVDELIGRSAADTENGGDVIHGVCSALGRSFFVGCVGAHKIILHLC